MASAMIEPAVCDALLVFHRLTPPGVLCAAVRTTGAQRVALLTTHRPFAFEREGLATLLAPASVTFHHFAQFLDDAALAEIDDATSAELRPANLAPADYTEIFQHRLTQGKNAAVRARILGLFSPRHIFVAHGLGLDGSVWHRHGAHLLERGSRLAALRLTAAYRRCRALVETLRHSGFGRCLRRLRKSRPAQGHVVHDGTVGYVFAAGFRRIRPRPGTPVRHLPLTTALADPTVRFVATTLHDNPVSAHRLGRPVRIFVDGYLPTNYPRTYIDALPPTEIVSADPFAARWFALHGRTALRAPSFIDPGYFSTNACSSPIRTVVCLLNHTGDWSALINRSDTDILAETFAQLAARHATLRFILRAHPGMDHSCHEGHGALARLAELVTRTAQPNLEFSRAPLSADLDRGDLFISEYSNTLIDAWRAGKLGLVANLTARRSFMQDFTDLGFAGVNSDAELHAALLSACADATCFAAHQSAAASRYNSLLPATCTEFIASPPPKQSGLSRAKNSTSPL